MRKVALSILLITSFLVPVSAQAATAKAGASCPKAKATQTVGSKKFTCIKSGKKLVWDKGVTVPKAATPKPTATTTPTTPPATTTPTPPVVVVKKAQEIDFPALKDAYVIDKKLGLTKATTSGGLAVSYSASGACSYDAASNSVSLTAAGNCSITASQPGDANYLPAPVITRTFEILKSAQEIEFTKIDDAYLADEEIPLSEGITSAGLTVSMSASGACTYDAANNSILLKSVGKCSVTASQAGDAIYLPATPITRTFEIKKTAQTIEVEEFEEQDLAESQGISLSFSSEADAPDVVVTTSTAAVCTVVGNEVTFVAIGECKLTFNKAGNASYEAAPTITRTIKIISSVVPGSEESPADFGIEIIKGDISVTVDGINEEVSDAICEADSSNEACIDENGSGVLDPDSESRYVEVLLTITNNSKTTWAADQLTLQIDGETFDFTSVYTIDSLEGLELEPGDSITGSFFVLLPNEIDSAESLVIYGNNEEETTFFFKAKL